MFDTFFNAICRVGIFVICAQSIVHFRPKGEYEKYLKLLVSIMILIQLFIPIGSMIFKGEEMALALKEFEQQLKQSVESAEKSAAEADKRLEEMTLEEVRKRLEEQEKMQQMQENEAAENVTTENQEPEIEIQVEAVVIE